MFIIKEKRWNITNIYTVKTSILILRWPELEITFLPSLGIIMIIDHIFLVLTVCQKLNFLHILTHSTPTPTAHTAQNIFSLWSHFLDENTVSQSSVTWTTLQDLWAVDLGFKPGWTDFPAYLLNLITLPKVLFKVEGRFWTQRDKGH